MFFARPRIAQTGVNQGDVGKPAEGDDDIASDPGARNGFDMTGSMMTKAGGDSCRPALRTQTSMDSMSSMVSSTRRSLHSLGTMGGTETERPRSHMEKWSDKHQGFSSEQEAARLRKKGQHKRADRVEALAIHAHASMSCENDAGNVGVMEHGPSERLGPSATASSLAPSATASLGSLRVRDLPSSAASSQASYLSSASRPDDKKVSRMDKWSANWKTSTGEVDNAAKEVAILRKKGQHKRADRLEAQRKAT